MPRKLNWRLIAGLLLAGVGGGSVSSAEPGPTEAVPAPAAVTSQQLQQWALDLDADDFFVRQRATERLILAGEPAVACLQPVLEGGSLEANTRAIHILQELALSTDLATEKAARAALETTAVKRFGAVARRATSALATLNELRRERALTDLEKLGVTLIKESLHNGFNVVEAVTGAEIGPSFTGRPEELRLLAWIDLPQFRVIFSGPQIGNEHLKYLPDMKTVTAVQLKRTSVTNAGLSVLPEIGQLGELAIMNTPVNDEAFGTLRTCRGLMSVRLYGTKFTRDTAQRLQTALGAKVDYRVGAFLGVGGQQTLHGCEVGIVQENSAAAEAGIEVGDIIVRVGDKKVADFESLTEIISMFAGGDSVELEVLRNDHKLTKKITFGEWE